VGLIQRAIEKENIPTISVSLNLTITEKVRPPRALLVDFPLGHPMGNPFDKGLQKQILMTGLRCLKEISRPATIVDLRGAYRDEPGKCALCTVEVA
jgi:D-proline reductase (dithiol) PrdB